MSRKIFIKILTFCFLLAFPTFTIKASIFKTNVEKGFDALKAGDLKMAENWFLKSELRYPALAAFGLANCFVSDSFPKYNLDSAYFLANKSIGLWSTNSKTESNLANRLGININDIVSLADAVVLKAFNLALNEGAIQSYDQFIFSFPVKVFVDSAIVLRNRLAFSMAEKDGSASAYLSFINKYPDSQFYSVAKNRYNRLLYEESVNGGTIGEYEVFIRSFPTNPFVEDAWKKLFSLTTKNSLLEMPYLDFILKYPDNPMSDEAWYRIRENFITKNPGVSIDSFMVVYPGFPSELDADPFYDHDSELLLPFVENGQWGFMDTSGLVFIPPTYSAASTFHDGLARVMVNTQFGFINFKGEEVVKPYYESATDFYKGFSVVSENNRFGAIDRRGNTVVPVSYDSVKIAGDNLFIVFQDGFCNYLSRLGELIGPSGCIQCGLMQSGYAIGSMTTGMGVLRSDGTVVMDFNARDIQRISNAHFSVKAEGGYAIADTGGRILTKYVFDQVGVYSNGLAAASVDGRFGYIDVKGRSKIPFIFQVLEGFPETACFHDGLAVVSLTGSFGIVDTTGNVLIGDSFDQIRLLGEDLAVVYENGKGALLLVTSESFLTSAEFDSTGFLSFGSLPIFVNGKWGAINTAGKMLLTAQYDVVIPAPQGYHVYKLETGYGVADSKGVEVVDAIYDHASLYNDRFIKLDFAGKFEWFDIDAAKMLTPQK